MRRIHLSIFCLWLFSTPSYGVVFTLFQQGKQAADYNWILRDLMTVPEIYEDSVFLQFDHGQPIEIVSFLGHGGLTAVFLRKDGRALRIPLSSGHAFFRPNPQDEFIDYGPFTDHMLDYWKAMNKIGKFAGIIPKISVIDSHPPQYITVDFFPAQFHIHDFYHRRDKLIASQKLSIPQIEALENQLLSFARRLAVFQHIGDFKYQQLVSDGIRWRLLDASEKVKYARQVMDPNPFDHRNMGSKLPADVYRKINHIIQQHRSENPHLLQMDFSSKAPPAKLCQDIFLIRINNEIKPFQSPLHRKSFL